MDLADACVSMLFDFRSAVSIAGEGVENLGCSGKLGTDIDRSLALDWLLFFSRVHKKVDHERVNYACEPRLSMSVAFVSR